MPEDTLLPSCLAGKETARLYTKLMKTLLLINCDCKKLCNEIGYKTVGIRVNEDSKENETLFSVLFVQNDMMTITERFAYDTTNLMSDIGGTLGLYLGLSILSILQLILGVMRKCIAFLRKKQDESPSRCLLDSITQKVDAIYLEEMQHQFYVPNASGLAVIFDRTARPAVKALLFLVVFGSLTYISVFVYIRFTLYLTERTRMTLILDKHDELNFPNVTICGYERTIIQLFLKFAKKKKMYQPDTNKVDWCPLHLEHLLDIPRITADSLWKKSSVETEFGKDADSLMQIMGLKMVENVSDNAIDMPEGKCVQFNVGKQKFSGTGSMFTQRTFSKAWLAFSKEMTKCGRSYYTLYYTVPDTPFHLNTRIQYSYGSVTMLAVEYRKITVLNRKKHPCVSSAEANACYNRCFENAFFNSNIPCRMPYMLPLSNLTTCNSSQAAIDAKAVYLDFALPFNPMLYPECGCVRRCETTVLTFMPYSAALKEGITVLVVFFFSNLLHHLREEEPDSLSSLICDVGGNIGLALGFSFLSICNLVSLTVRRLMTKKEHERKAAKKKQKNKDNS